MPVDRERFVEGVGRGIEGGLGDYVDEQLEELCERELGPPPLVVEERKEEKGGVARC